MEIFLLKKVIRKFGPRNFFPFPPKLSAKSPSMPGWCCCALPNRKLSAVDESAAVVTDDVPKLNCGVAARPIKLLFAVV